MGIYSFKCKYYEDALGEEIEDIGMVAADSYGEAVEYITNSMGKYIENIFISMVNDADTNLIYVPEHLLKEIEDINNY